MLEGTLLAGRYEVDKRIGAGGMSDVYRAKDLLLGRNVAIKVLKQEFSEDRTFVSKFRTEAQSAAGLEHPNIVNIYDVGIEEGTYYIVMEYVDGITLKTYIEKKGKLNFKESVSIAIQVARGIEAAHNKDIIHRDIKPQNIIISSEGKVKVTDFGIARAASANTISSDVMGSVHYASPEQARNGFVDERSDIYSLGIVMYEMITGRVPFDGESTVAVAIQHLQDEMVSPKEYAPDIPKSFEMIIRKCTQKSQERRYQTIGEVMTDLRRSFLEPNGDFVVIPPLFDGNATQVFGKDEVDEIRAIQAAIRAAKLAKMENLGEAGAEQENSDKKKNEEPHKLSGSNTGRKNGIEFSEAEEYEGLNGDDLDYDYESQKEDPSGEKSEESDEKPDDPGRNSDYQGEEEDLEDLDDLEDSDDLEDYDDLDDLDDYDDLDELEDYDDLDYDDLDYDDLDYDDLDYDDLDELDYDDLEYEDPEYEAYDEEEEEEEKTPSRENVIEDYEDEEEPDYDDDLEFLVDDMIGKNSAKKRNPSQRSRHNETETTDPRMEKIVTVMGLLCAIAIIVFALYLIGDVFGVFHFKNNTAETQQVQEVQKVTMISILGEDSTEAERKLKKLGFSMVVEDIQESDRPEGTVIRQNYNEGDEVAEGSEIRVIIAGVNPVEIPNVVGYNETTAAQTLANAHLTAQKSFEYSDTIPAGTIISQSPEKGKVTQGTVVKLTVSQGSETTSVPNVVGKSEEYATEALVQAGFKVNVKTSYSNTATVGFVIKQSPESGKTVQTGKTVSITVSLGSKSQTPAPQEPVTESDPENSGTGEN